MHARNEIAFCAYIIPGGPATNNDLHRVHHDIIQKDPFVSKALAGTNVVCVRKLFTCVRACACVLIIM